MFFIFKFFIYFSFSFFILSLPIQEKPLFDKIYNITGPVTYEMISFLKNKVGRTTTDLREVGEKAFSNTRDIPQNVDEVSSELSSTVKEEIEEHDSYTVEERESLLRVLKRSE